MSDMTIQQGIQGLIDALNRNAAAVEASNKLVAGGAGSSTNTNTTSSSKSKIDKQAETDAKAEKAAVDKEPKYSAVQVQGKIKEVATKFDKDVAREMFEDLGYAKMAEIKPEHHETVFDRCVAKLDAGADDL